MTSLFTPAYSLGLVCGVGVAAWISGALFGWSLKEVRSFVRAAPLRSHAASVAIDDRKRRTPGKSRRDGYYFSEETRSWGIGRWRRRAGYVLLFLIVSALTASLVVAAMDYKAPKLPSVGSTASPSL